jgi:hypothetical protein
MVRKDWFVSFLRRNPSLTLRKAENLSYGRLMRFNRGNVDDFFNLLTQTMDAMNSQKRPYLIYDVDETGLQLTYTSGNQKLLAVNGSKNFTLLLTKKMKYRDRSGLHECEWKQMDPPSGSVRV